MVPAWIARRTSEDLMKEVFPPRKSDSHKGDYGKVVIVAGCRAYSGAAVLAARAAVRSGSGLVRLVVPDLVWQAAASRLDSEIVLPAPCDSCGRFSLQALPLILEEISHADACLLGPGLGRSNELDQLVMGVLTQCRIPLVLDADGLNAVAAHIDMLREAACPVILTPHEGEFARLTRCNEPDRVVGTALLAGDTGCVVLRKGCRTVISDGCSHYVNTTGNPGLAAGGSGDVLAGILVSILGRGFSPLKAAAAAAWLHGRAGDLCAARMGQYAMSPADLTEVMGELLP